MDVGTTLLRAASHTGQRGDLGWPPQDMLDGGGRAREKLGLTFSSAHQFLPIHIGQADW